MAQQLGEIKTLTEKGYGFISRPEHPEKDLFFHMTSVKNAHYEELFEGQQVSFDTTVGPKGDRADNVTPVESATTGE